MQGDAAAKDLDISDEDAYVTLKGEVQRGSSTHFLSTQVQIPIFIFHTCHRWTCFGG
jgi:hypothetical protein